MRAEAEYLILFFGGLGVCYLLAGEGGRGGRGGAGGDDGMEQSLV